MSFKNLLGNTLFKVPYLGKRLHISKLNSTLLEIDHIKKQFNKPMVRFDNNLHSLYDCLQGLDLVLQEDIPWFLTLDVTCYSNTSTDATKYLQGHFNNEFPKEEHYFKNKHANGLETEFLAWYSNLNTAQEFVDRFMYVLDLYCTENPRHLKANTIYYEEQDDLGVTAVYQVYRNKELNGSLLEFFLNQPFRLLLDDFLVMVEVVIYSQLRRLNGSAT